MKSNARSRREQAPLAVGQDVSFEARGRVHVGTVIRRNRTTFTVETPAGRWRVSPSYLSPASAADRTATRAAPQIPAPGFAKGDIVRLNGIGGAWLVVHARDDVLIVLGGVPPYARCRVGADRARLAASDDPEARDLQVAFDIERSGWRVGDRIRWRDDEYSPATHHGTITGLFTERARVRDTSGAQWGIPYNEIEGKNRRAHDAVRVRAVHAFARKILTEQSERLPEWRFALDDGQRRAGACHAPRRLVTVSRQFALEAPWEEVVDTVIHEVAHALTPGHNHDRVWQAAAKGLGGTARRTHTVRFGAGSRRTRPG